MTETTIIYSLRNHDSLHFSIARLNWFMHIKNPIEWRLLALSWQKMLKMGDDLDELWKKQHWWTRAREIKVKEKQKRHVCLSRWLIKQSTSKSIGSYSKFKLCKHQTNRTKPYINVFSIYEVYSHENRAMIRDHDLSTCDTDFHGREMGHLNQGHASIRGFFIAFGSMTSLAIVQLITISCKDASFSFLCSSVPWIAQNRECKWWRCAFDSSNCSRKRPVPASKQQFLDDATAPWELFVNSSWDWRPNTAIVRRSSCTLARL